MAKNYGFLLKLLVQKDLFLKIKIFKYFKVLTVRRRHKNLPLKVN